MNGTLSTLAPTGTDILSFIRPVQRDRQFRGALDHVIMVADSTG